MLRRSFDVEVRGIDEEKRSATFVAATERSVPMSYGRGEVLRMNGARLARYRKNPVVLDSHDRASLDSVIGRADVKVQGRELHATITYAKTERGERAWSLVRDGFVRAVSVGYLVNERRVRRLREGEIDGEGESAVTGPADVCNEWEMMELSNVPVPADQDAVRRAFYDKLEVRMDPLTAAMTGGNPTPKPAKPVLTPEQKAAKREAKVALKAASKAAKMREAHRRSVLAITPRGLEAEAESAILKGLDFEQCRAHLLEAQARRFKPVGTPEPKAPEIETTTTREAALPDWVTDDVLVRSFQNLR